MTDKTAKYRTEIQQELIRMAPFTCRAPLCEKSYEAQRTCTRHEKEKHPGLELQLEQLKQALLAAATQEAISNESLSDLDHSASSLAAALPSVARLTKELVYNNVATTAGHQPIISTTSLPVKMAAPDHMDVDTPPSVPPQSSFDGPPLRTLVKKASDTGESSTVHSSTVLPVYRGVTRTNEAPRFMYNEEDSPAYDADYWKIRPASEQAAAAQILGLGRFEAQDYGLNTPDLRPAHARGFKKLTKHALLAGHSASLDSGATGFSQNPRGGLFTGHAASSGPSVTGFNQTPRGGLFASHAASSGSSATGFNQTPRGGLFTGHAASSNSSTMGFDDVSQHSTSTGFTISSGFNETAFNQSSGDSSVTARTASPDLGAIGHNIPTLDPGELPEHLMRALAINMEKDLFLELTYANCAQMMYVSGETAEPSTDTTGMVEEIVRQQVIEMLRRCTEQATRRGVKSISTDDLIFIIREDSAKVSRLQTFLSWKDVRKNVKDSDDTGKEADLGTGDDPAGAGAAPIGAEVKKNKKAKIGLPWDISSFFSETVPELEDEEDEDEEELNSATMSRLRKADERTSAMTKEEYVTWSEYRQASFTFRKGKRFKDWAGFGLVTDSKPNDDIIDILGFLTFEMVQTLTEEALKIKEQDDLNKVNAGNVNDGDNEAEGEGAIKKRRITGLFDPPSEGRTPVGPSHIQEAFRRLQRRPLKKSAMMGQSNNSIRTDLRIF